MPSISLPRPYDGMTIEDVMDSLSSLSKTVEWLANGKIDSENVREISGFNVSPTVLKHKSGIVGMNGGDPLNASAVRFWAGNANPSLAPFRVQQDGTMYATNGNFSGTITGSTITGGTVRTATSGARIEIGSNSLQTYNASNQLNGFQNGLTTSGTTYGDAFFYSAGTEALRIYNTVTNGYSIFPVNGFTMRLGASGTTTFANGTWNFSSGASGTVYVAATSGGSPTVPITFSTGLRTS